MDSFLRKVIEGRVDEDAHRYFVRFGRGEYKRRFLIKLNKGSKIKIKTSFELANDLVKFVEENKDLKFSGKVLMKDKIPGKEGKKKAGVFVYEIEESSIKEYDNAYYYLLDVNDSEIILKIKKSLPKPGKEGDKIDDKFCTLEISDKYWPALKEAFFWDVPDCKKAEIEHTLKINDIVLPNDEKDPVKIRELSKRKGAIARKIVCDGRETERDYPLEA